MSSGTKHIALPDLYDFVCGTVSMDAAAHAHIEECEHCQSDVSWLRWMVGFGVREKEYEPPTRAAASAEKSFRLRKPGIVQVAREVVASLVYDTASAPLQAGVRGHDMPARQALYRTDHVQLDLKIELGDEKGLIIGQLVADKSDTVITGLEIELTQKGEVVGTSRTNALGEFIFQDLPRGNYELQLVLNDTRVKLPSFPLVN
jgi:hypothetical protein